MKFLMSPMFLSMIIQLRDPKLSIWIKMGTQKQFLKIQESEDSFGNMHKMFITYCIVLDVQEPHFLARKCKFADLKLLFLDKSVLKKEESQKMLKWTKSRIGHL